MPITAEQVLVQLRALTPAERLYVVERIVHELASEIASPAITMIADPIWRGEDDAEYEAFQVGIQRLRQDDLWRTGDVGNTRPDG
ncbi:MAG TPA: hypothetical protein VKP30_08455 [Polyangiaceae bacterium]|nr:hypothetical protein [Polyangiaceae bacterium]